MRLYYFSFIFLVVLGKAQAQEQQTIIYLDSLNQPSNAEDYFYKIEIGNFDKNANAYETIKYKKEGIVAQKGWSLDQKVWKKTHDYYAFFDSGKLQRKVHCVNGREVGPVTVWYENGSKRFEGTHEVGLNNKIILQLTNYWNSNGEKIVDNGNGNFLLIEKNMKQEGVYKNGYQDGEWKFTNLKTGEKRIKNFSNKNFVSGTYIDAKNNRRDFNEEGVIKPTPPGGREEFKIHLMDNLIKKLTNTNFENIIVRFFVEKDGTLSNMEVLESSNENLNAEIMRVIRTAGKWKPAEIEGEIIRYRATQIFTIRESD